MHFGYQEITRIAMSEDTEKYRIGTHYDPDSEKLTVE